MARGYTESLEQLMELLSHMPGVGEKTAERLAYHILRLPREEALALADAISEVKDKVKQCSTCFHFSESDPCAICGDPRRDRSIICVVEESKDVVTMEQTEYRGLYHVLCGRLAPLDGIEPNDLTVDRLVERASDEDVEEVILACNADMEGEATVLYVREALADVPVKVTRLARGIPAGSQLDYANSAVLGDALEGRREISQSRELET